MLGPIAKHRWIYSCSKQLLDRVIWAYGQQQGLRFTLFRPFNWVGPNLDHIETAKEGSSRVVTQFLGHLLRGEPLRLVDGGAQRRCITDIRDGIDALMRILRNEGGRADGRILNIGNPRNDCSIAELANLLIDILAGFDRFRAIRKTAVIEKVSSEDYYGEGYQDIYTRVPDITNARECLGWEPRYSLRDALTHTVAALRRRGFALAAACRTAARCATGSWRSRSPSLFAFAGLANHPLQATDETRVAGIGWEMQHTGQWWVPHLAGVPFLEHPPLHYAVLGTFISWFGASEAVARLPGAVAGLLTALLVFSPPPVARLPARFALLTALLVFSSRGASPIAARGCPRCSRWSGSRPSRATATARWSIRRSRCS